MFVSSDFCSKEHISICFCCCSSFVNFCFVFLRMLNHFFFFLPVWRNVLWVLSSFLSLWKVLRGFIFISTYNILYAFLHISLSSSPISLFLLLLHSIFGIRVRNNYRTSKQTEPSQARGATQVSYLVSNESGIIQISSPLGIPN